MSAKTLFNPSRKFFPFLLLCVIICCASMPSYDFNSDVAPSYVETLNETHFQVENNNAQAVKTNKQATSLFRKISDRQMSILLKSLTAIIGVITISFLLVRCVKYIKNRKNNKSRRLSDENKQDDTCGTDDGNNGDEEAQGAGAFPEGDDSDDDDEDESDFVKHFKERIRAGEELTPEDFKREWFKWRGRGPTATATDMLEAKNGGPLPEVEKRDFSAEPLIEKYQKYLDEHGAVKPDDFFTQTGEEKPEDGPLLDEMYERWLIKDDPDYANEADLPQGYDTDFIRVYGYMDSDDEGEEQQKVDTQEGGARGTPGDVMEWINKTMAQAAIGDDTAAEGEEEAEKEKDGGAAAAPTGSGDPADVLNWIQQTMAQAESGEDTPTQDKTPRDPETEKFMEEHGYDDSATDQDSEDQSDKQKQD